MKWPWISRKKYEELEQKLKQQYKDCKYIVDKKDKEIVAERQTLQALIPIIMGLRSNYDYEKDLIYITTVIDTKVFYRTPGYDDERVSEYLADQVAYKLKKEISMINMSRLPDYCRKLQR